MANHYDQVTLQKVNYVYQLESTEYGELWDSAKFNDPVKLGAEAQAIQQSGDTVTGTVVRKFPDGQYLVAVPVTYQTGYFSDNNFVVASDADFLSITPLK